MTASTIPFASHPSSTAALAERALNASATLWYCVMVTGQLLFVVYVAMFYGGAVAQGDLSRWNAVVPHAHVPGDGIGNLAMGLHVLFAVVIIGGGALELLPQLRRIAPRFHRWNGRVYVALAVLTSVIGMGMMWLRSSTGDLTQHLGLSLDAVLIVAFAFLAVRHARAGDLAAHRRWALRLFMAVSAVWFFRVGLMLWIVANQGPALFDPVTFTGPALSFLAFAQYLVPLAVLELYLRARRNGSAGQRLAMAGGLLVCSVAMGVGIGAAGMIMWLPRM